MIGNLILICFYLITLTLFLLSKSNFDQITIFTLLAQVSGLLASTTISLNYILATRTKIIEKIFGGLDRVYRNHNFLGNTGFILACLHPIFLILNMIPLNFTKFYLVPSLSNLPYSYGMMSLYSLIIFVSLTIFIKLPYKFWKKTHEFIVIVLVFALLHAVTIDSDVSIYMPLRFWILTINSLGLIAYTYKRFLYYYFLPKNNFLVKKVLIEDNYLLLDLQVKNNSKIPEIKSGQYVFISNNSDIRDEHPFSVMEYSDRTIKLGAKKVGNFTNWLSKLRQNEVVNVHGPFGFFSESIEKQNKIVFLSAGIGITPFYSMAKNILKDQDITMIHSDRSTDPLLITNLFLKIKDPNFKFIRHTTDLKGRLNTQILKKYISLDNKTKFYICGPDSFMAEMYNLLIDEGVKRRNIKYEDFSFK